MLHLKPSQARAYQVTYSLLLICLSARDLGDTRRRHLPVDEGPITGAGARGIGTRGLLLCQLGLYRAGEKSRAYKQTMAGVFLELMKFTTAPGTIILFSIIPPMQCLHIKSRIWLQNALQNALERAQKSEN